ncbi:uncharacterized protein [Pocillopora verrucosa]|uniref:uncharacterized protein n=1 Tax=Pocillopora verrucosa TaxID=203993 RepID=UPI00333EAA57
MNWAMKFLQRRFQQLFTGLVLCVVHLGESPNYRSLLKFKASRRHRSYNRTGEGGAVCFSEKERQYLTSKFEIGEQSGRREELGQVSQDMRKAKGENGERLFSREEWLTKDQIQGFSSRLSSSRRRRAGPSPSTTVYNKSDKEFIDEEEVNHMTNVELVVTEIGLPHPIVYDIYDLCDYVKKEKLNYFTVSMLKEFCTFFELPFKSRDSKAFLMSKIKEMTHECRRTITPSSSDAIDAVYDGEIVSWL